MKGGVSIFPAPEKETLATKTLILRLLLS